MNESRVRREWSTRSGAYSPAYYAYHGPNETSARLRRTIERHYDPDAAVLEVGCSSGRHLAHLHEHGFEHLAGIDLNPAAFEVMADSYPALAATGDFRQGAIEDHVRDYPTGDFDVLYSVETLQHVHPDAAWTFAELVRITDGLLVTAETEPSDGAAETSVTHVADGVPLYRRDWGTVFTDLGLTQIDVTTGKRYTVRTFRAAE